MNNCLVINLLCYEFSSLSAYTLYTSYNILSYARAEKLRLPFKIFSFGTDEIFDYSTTLPIPRTDRSVTIGNLYYVFLLPPDFLDLLIARNVHNSCVDKNRVPVRSTYRLKFIQCFKNHIFLF